MNTKDAIRYTLIDLMEKSGTSGSELAEHVGVSKQSVSAWRNGKSCIDVENIPAICRFFGITIGELFGEARKKQDALAPDERRLLESYRSCSAEGKAEVMSFAEYQAVRRPKNEGVSRGAAI